MIVALLIACTQGQSPVSSTSIEDIPVEASVAYANDESTPFWVWGVDGDQVVDVDPSRFAISLASDDGDDEVSGDQNEPEGLADELDGEVNEFSDGVDDEPSMALVVKYAGGGDAPSVGMAYLPDEAERHARTTGTVTQSASTSIVFYYADSKNITSRVSPTGTYTVSSTYYTCTNSTCTSRSTLYGPVSYKSCNGGYNCGASSYGLGEKTTWSSGSPTVTHTFTTSCSVPCS